ncbi:hypothetical protein OAH36_02065 [Verrucomicrobia bacterium]|jgi:hypothetical protein|nr:hypothetical protein [Verrucomicrobiota bacterium]
MTNYIFLVAFAAMSTLSIANAKDPIAEGNFRKAIKAAGGEGRFSAIKAPTMWMETGTYYGMGEGVPFVAQYASYWPKRWRRQLIESRFAIGVAGEQVTLFEGGDTTGRKLTGPTYEAALHQARIGWAQLLYPLLEDDYTLSSIPGVDVEGEPTVGVKAVHDSGSEAMLYFDTRTFLLIKIEASVMAPEMDGKQVKNETFFSDHKSFGGVKLPGKYKMFYDGKLVVESETTAIKTHATIDPAWFGADGPARVR